MSTSYGDGPPGLTGTHYGGYGLGTFGALIPSDGENGPAINYQGLNLPAENNDEFICRILTVPGTLTHFFCREDGSFEAEGPDGVHQGTWRGYKNAVSYGESTYTVILGVGLAGTATLDDVGASGGLSTTATWPTVVTQPTGQIAFVPGTATFAYAFSGATSVQAQRRANSGQPWVNVAGATLTSYTTPPTSAGEYAEFRFGATGDGGGPVYTNTVPMTAFTSARLRMEQFNEGAVTPVNGVLSIVTDAEVTVKIAGTAVLADIYDGTTPKPNPFQASAYGSINFHAKNGLYDVYVDSPQRGLIILRDVALSSPTERVNLVDFMTPAQRLDYANRTLTLDISAAVNAAIAACRTLKIGEIDCGSGDGRIEYPILNPGRVTLIGNGGGRVYQPAVAAATRFVWYGAAGADMVKMGWGDDVDVGGGFAHMRLDGRAVAATCLHIKDHQHMRTAGLVLTGSTTSAHRYTNTPGRDPTGFATHTDMLVQLRGGSTNNATAMHVDGTGGGTGGVTLCTYIRPRFEHANGPGIRVGLRGDAFTFLDAFIWRADVETGIGILLESTAGSAGGQITSNWNFSGTTLISAGIRIDHPEGGIGWSIQSFADSDMSAGVSEVVYGAGAASVSVFSTYFGYRYGPCRLHGWRDTTHHDGMYVLRWDSANHTLFTRDGAWRTGGNYGTISDAGQPGGACRLTTTFTSGNVLYLLDTPDFTSGFSMATHHPNTVFTLGMGSDASYTKRVGWVADLNFNDGVYVEADPAVVAYWRCICVANGQTTAVVSSLGIANGLYQWRIERTTSGTIAFYYRTVGNKGWALAAHISTNLTAAVLSNMVWVRTNTGAERDFDFYDRKHVVRTEG